MPITRKISSISNYPQLGDPQFDSKADAFVKQLATVTINEMNNAFAEINSLVTNSGQEATLTLNVPSQYTTIQAAIDAGVVLSQSQYYSKVNINIAPGVYNITSPITINNIPNRKVEFVLTGAAPTIKNITSIGAISGSAGNWSIPLTVDDSSGLAVGDYVTVYNTVGNAANDPVKTVEGVWSITAVNGNTITVKNTCRKSTFPTVTLTSGKIAKHNTVVKATNSYVFIVGNNTTLNNICIVISGDGNAVYATARDIDITFKDHIAFYGGGGFQGITTYSPYVNINIIDAIVSVCNFNHGFMAGFAKIKAQYSTIITNGNVSYGFFLTNPTDALLWVCNWISCGNDKGIFIDRGSKLMIENNCYLFNNINGGVIINPNCIFDVGVLYSAYNTNGIACSGGMARIINANIDHNSDHGIVSIRTGKVHIAEGVNIINNTTDLLAEHASTIWVEHRNSASIVSPNWYTQGNNFGIIMYGY